MRVIELCFFDCFTTLCVHLWLTGVCWSSGTISLKVSCCTCLDQCDSLLPPPFHFLVLMVGLLADWIVMCSQFECGTKRILSSLPVSDARIWSSQMGIVYWTKLWMHQESWLTYSGWCVYIFVQYSWFKWTSTQVCHKYAIPCPEMYLESGRVNRKNRFCPRTEPCLTPASCSFNQNNRLPNRFY